MAATLFEFKEKMNTLAAQIQADADWIAEKAADPAVSIDDINAKKQHRDEMQARYDMIKAQHDELEEKQRTSIATKAARGATNEKDALVKAKADFYRNALAGGNTRKSYEGLGAIPAANADLGSGDKFLPANMSNELLMEPFEINPLRDIVHVTNITGLEEPKLGFTIEDADIADVTDKQTAKEIELEGDSVVYGRMKMKVSATIKDTVYHGTDLDIVSAVEGKLRSGLAKREKYFAFQSAESIDTNSDTAHAHMSFYNGTVSGDDVTYDITVKTGSTMYEAIVNALADLADDYAANARVVMKKSDYFTMIKDLTNDSEALFGSKPAAILGYPVVFCDKATIPVVGDFSYYGINYDIGAVYETDKDAKKGEYYFVFTAWGDQQIRLKSAFRLAIVEESGE